MCCIWLVILFLTALTLIIELLCGLFRDEFRLQSVFVLIRKSFLPKLFFGAKWENQPNALFTIKFAY